MSSLSASDSSRYSKLTQCPSTSAFSTNGPKCYGCQQFGHIARSCPNAAATDAEGGEATIVPSSVNGGVSPAAPPVGAAAPRAPYQGRGGFGGRGGFRGGFAGPGGRGGFFGGARPAVTCYACGGVNHLARNCTAGGGVAPAPRGPKTCYKVSQGD